MKLIVNPHKIEIEKNLVNEKEINITKVQFEFNNIPDDYVKEAYFTLKSNTYKVIIQNNECDIPYEVLEEKGTIEIGVVAFKVGEEYKRYNPSPVYINTLVGSLKDQFENSEEITPTDKEQIEQILQDGITDIQGKIDEVDNKIIEVNNAIEETNNLNIDVNKVEKETTITLTKKDNTTKSAVVLDGKSLQFMWQGTSLGIKTDDMQDYVFVNLQGVQGVPGPQGEPFRIKKTYPSVQAMNDDFNNMNYGDYVMIASTVEVEDNAKLYTRGEFQWIFITDFSGATGIKGETGATPNIQIGTVTSGSTPNVTRTGTDENPILNFTLVKGDTGSEGPVGPTGNGISNIEKTSETSTEKNYRINYTNGEHFDYSVENGEVTQEQLDEVQADLDRYKTIENALPHITGEGESITLNDTANSVLHLDLKGNTQQDSTSISGGDEYDSPTPDHPQPIHNVSGDNTIKVQNKNLYKPFNFTKTSNGITFTYNENGYININGTSTGNALSMYTNEATPYLITLEAGTYTISGNTDDIRLEVVSSGGTPLCNTGSTNIFTINSTTQIFIRANILNGKTFDNVKVYPQLEKGTTATDYVEHQEQSQLISLGVENLLPNNVTSQTINSIEFTKNNDKSVYANGTASERTDLYLVGDSLNYEDLGLMAGTYTLSGCVSGGSYTTYMLVCVTQHSDTTTTIKTDFGENTTVQVQTGDKFRIFIRVANGGSVDGTFYPQLEKGSKANSYTPYGTTPIELCKIGDYQDYFYKSSGKWYLHKEIGKVVLDGSENWGTSTSSGNIRCYTSAIANLINKNVAPILNYFIGSTDTGNIFTNGYATLPASGNISFYYPTTTDSTTTFKTWLSTHNTEVYYVLATPTNEAITDTTLIGQLDNIEKLMSYDGQTNISQDNNDLPFIISASAIRKLNNE